MTPPPAAPARRRRNRTEDITADSLPEIAPTRLYVLDTNVLVRYFAQDDIRQSAIATRLLEEVLTAADRGLKQNVCFAIVQKQT